MTIKELTIVSKEKIILQVPVNEYGAFSISSSSLLTTREDYWRLIRSQSFIEQYKVNYNNYDLNFDQKVITGSSLNFPEPFNLQVRSRPATFISQFNFDSMNHLAEVVIKNKGEAIGDYWSQTCEDYVGGPCNILNCYIHPPGTPGNYEPAQGETYSVRSNINTIVKVVYRGCANGLSRNSIKSILIPKEFNLVDYEKNPNEEPVPSSTIYWNPNITTDQKGKATFSFYTGGRGDFTLMAQGIEVNTIKPLYGLKEFTIK